MSASVVKVKWSLSAHGEWSFFFCQTFNRVVKADPVRLTLRCMRREN